VCTVYVCVTRARFL